MTGARAARVGIVALLAAYAVFAWPGLYHLAHGVLAIRESVQLGPLRAERAWLFPASVDGGIFVAGVILLTHRSLSPALRTELWRGMWVIAGLSGLGLVVDELARLLGFGFPPAAAIPLVLAPVGIATWFLHLVVRATQPDAVPTLSATPTEPAHDAEPPAYDEALARVLDREMDRLAAPLAEHRPDPRLAAVPPLPADSRPWVERAFPPDVRAQFAAEPTPGRVHAKVTRTGKSQATGPCADNCFHHRGVVSKSTRYRCAPGGDCRICHPKES